MQSVGEVMAIGRNFKESLQKALLSLETDLNGLDRIKNFSKNKINKELEKNSPNKILVIAEAFRHKINLNKIYSKTKIDRWFLEQIKEIVDAENILIKYGLPTNPNEMNYIKSIGFSDKKISELTKKSIEYVKNIREKLGVFSSQYVDFIPTHLEIKYRGKLAEHDGTLLRLCFLKGLLQSRKNFVSYVNADQQAENVGLHIEETDDPGFTDYESALKCTLAGAGKKFAIGGVVFSGPHPRITLINSFVCEFEAEGTILVSTNQDRPGMVGILGTCLGKNGVNIDQFQLSRNTRGGEALALIRVDDDLPKSVVEEIRKKEGITSVSKIVL